MNFMWMAGDELAGDLYYTYDQEGQFYYMTFQNGNTFLNQGWEGLFRVVSYCNNIINGMPAAASSNGISQEIINRALGEARCIRGIAYYFLTEYWQDVPIITNNNIFNVLCSSIKHSYFVTFLVATRRTANHKPFLPFLPLGTYFFNNF